MSKQNSVVMVGRMNVGKSTLFNRLAPQVKSMVLDYAGVTRDLIRDVVSWNGKTFDVIDTGGISFRASEDVIIEKVRTVALQAIEQATVVLLVVDGSVGVTSGDIEISRILHKMHKKVIVVVNKSDCHITTEHLHEFNQLQHEAHIPISAEHGRNIEELLDLTTSFLPAGGSAEEKSAFGIVFLGKPNVGKSSLMNALVGHTRSIVSDIAGTTREAVSEQISFYSENIQLTDTPGVRKKRSVSDEIETLMVKEAFHAVRSAQIVILVLDGSSGEITDQELKLAFFTFSTLYKGLVLVINKSDLMTDEIRKRIDHSLLPYKHLMEKIPTIFVSSKTGKNVGRLLPLITTVRARYEQRLPSEEIQQLFISELKKRPLVRCEQFLQVFGVRQVAIKPITLALAVNNPPWFEDSQLAFFDRLLRTAYDLVGVPVKFLVYKNRIPHDV